MHLLDQKNCKILMEFKEKEKKSNTRVVTLFSCLHCCCTVQDFAAHNYPCVDHITHFVSPWKHGGFGQCCKCINLNC